MLKRVVARSVLLVVAVLANSSVIFLMTMSMDQWPPNLISVT